MIAPLPGKYYCEIIQDAKLLSSGIWLADNINEVPHRAKVLESGKESKDKKGKAVPQSAKKGDIIHFKRLWNRELPKDKEKIFVKEEEIVGVER
jgi:co-chaperonin GroES (HSP10)